MRIGGYVVLATYPSKSSDAIYEVRRGGDGVLYCICRGWQNSRTAPKVCTHTKDYAAQHPGTEYGPPGMFTQAPAEAATAKAARPGVAPPPPVATAPAGADWRAQIFAEREGAAQRGVVTPPDALALFVKEVG